VPPSATCVTLILSRLEAIGVLHVVGDAFIPEFPFSRSGLSNDLNGNLQVLDLSTFQIHPAYEKTTVRAEEMILPNKKVRKISDWLFTLCKTSIFDFLINSSATLRLAYLFKKGNRVEETA